jgi:hypothetical protein
LHSIVTPFRFEQRFSSARMATDYVAHYRSLLKQASMAEREAAVPRHLLARSSEASIREATI